MTNAMENIDDESNIAEQCIENMIDRDDESTICEACGITFPADEYAPGIICPECEEDELVIKN